MSVEKDLHLCKKQPPFILMDDYHYYNPTIYSMGGVYFKGQNLRQMKRYCYIIWRLNYGYQNLYKHSLLYGSNKQLDKMLAITKILCKHGQQVYEELSQWPVESKYSKDKGTFYNYVSKSRHRPTEEIEEKTRNAKYFICVDKWGHEKKELITIADFEKHWASFMEVFFDECRLFVSWGHWLTYLFESDMESGEDTGLDLKNLNQLIEKGKKFEGQINKFRFGQL